MAYCYKSTKYGHTFEIIIFIFTLIKSLIWNDSKIIEGFFFSFTRLLSIITDAIICIVKANSLYYGSPQYLARGRTSGYKTSTNKKQR